MPSKCSWFCWVVFYARMIYDLGPLPTDHCRCQDVWPTMSHEVTKDCLPNPFECYEYSLFVYDNAGNIKDFGSTCITVQPPKFPSVTIGYVPYTLYAGSRLNISGFPLSRYTLVLNQDLYDVKVMCRSNDYDRKLPQLSIVNPHTTDMKKWAICYLLQWLLNHSILR